MVLTPGIYQIDEPLQLNHEGQVLLGLGLATLISSKQNVVIEVGDVGGVHIAGIIVQAGAPGENDELAPALIRWGSGSRLRNSETTPGFLHDVFARVGGPDGTNSDVSRSSVLSLSCLPFSILLTLSSSLLSR